MEPKLSDLAVLKSAEKIISKYNLCDACFGRQFSKVQSGITNEHRGKQLRKHLKQSKETTACECWLCQGLLDEIPLFIKIIKNTLKEYDYDTFLIGSKVDEDIQDREQQLKDSSEDDYVESIKTELNREMGKILEKDLKKVVDFLNPTIMVIFNTVYDDIQLQIQSLYLYGRYKKYKRDIPQTKWFCKICTGKGCKRCNYTGTMYDTSVEQIIGDILLRYTGGSEAILHGCGREDIDALMLGNGRPFVMEIKNSKQRKINYSKAQREINESSKDVIEISNMRLSDKDEVSRLKEEKFNKIYRVVFIGETAFGKEKLKEAARILQGTTVEQYTPTRVAHRRANKVRQRKIYNCRLESVDNTIATFTIEAESGTYIKELITSDDGKTKPSLSEIIGIPCSVKELDVIEIKGE